MENDRQDDGSLAYLGIEHEVKTKFGTGRYLVKIKFKVEDADTEARKFFTNSQEIKYVLGKIKERNAFPRKVTMRASGTRYYFE